MPKRLTIIITLLFLLSPTLCHAQQKSGVVRPERTFLLSFAKTGLLTMGPEEGQEVAKGGLIAKLDDRQERLALAEAEAGLESARLDLHTSQHNHDKIGRLVKEKVLAPISLKEAEFSLQQSQTLYHIAELNLEKAQLALQYTELHSPGPGVVTQVMAHLGEFTSPDQPVAEITDLSSLKIVVDLELKQADRLNPDQQATIIIDQKNIGTAKVKTILPLLDPASGLRRVIWTVTSNNGMLAGRYVTLSWEDGR